MSNGNQKKEEARPKLVGKENFLWGGLGKIELWDFSFANFSKEHRVNAFAKIASSYCNASDKERTEQGMREIFDRALENPYGKESNALEYIPVLLNMNSNGHRELFEKNKFSHILRSGETLTEGWYVTTLSALAKEYYDMSDVEDGYSFNITEIYNDDDECALLSEFFTVFFLEANLDTVVRLSGKHLNVQEFSRGCLLNKDMPFSPYFSEEVYASKEVDVPAFFGQSLKVYETLVSSGVSHEKARLVLPQGAMSYAWGGFTPNELERLMKMRDYCDAEELLSLIDAIRTLLPLRNKPCNLKLIGSPIC